jgi:AcrR family transcriptional regulator
MVRTLTELLGGVDSIQTCLYKSSVSTKRASTSAARQRILETADRLFYQDGIRAVGIDRIVAEAGVAKMTLYAYFPSKDDLIVAVLQYREAKVLEFFRSAMARSAKRPTDTLRAFFAALKEWYESPGFRGCAFQNAAVELADPGHAGAQFVRDHKRRFADLLRGCVEESAGKSAAKLAPAIALLVEGAILTAVIHGTPEAAEVARDAALILVAAAKSV